MHLIKNCILIWMFKELVKLFWMLICFLKSVYKNNWSSNWKCLFSHYWVIYRNRMWKDWLGSVHLEEVDQLDWLKSEDYVWYCIMPMLCIFIILVIIICCRIKSWTWISIVDRNWLFLWMSLWRRLLIYWLLIKLKIDYLFIYI
jgi:hypothetical protein